MRFLVERSVAARLTCETLRSAYVNACRAEGWDKAPPAGAVDELTFDGVSPYEENGTCVQGWLCDLRTSLRAVQPGPGRGQDVAVVVVGHDPRMGWLLHDLVKRWRRLLVPALSHTELIACGRKTDDGRYIPCWALSPTDAKVEEAVVGKVRSKMDTAKVFAAVLAAVISFVANNVAGLDDHWRRIGLFGLGALGLATVLYLVTMFWYDRLLMPSRFWPAEAPARPTGLRSLVPRPFPVLSRPPSSSAWVLYQNMQLVWRRCFVPATWSAGVGVVSYVTAVSRPQGTGGWLGLVVGVAAFGAVAAGVGWRARPVLGVQD